MVLLQQHKKEQQQRQQATIILKKCPTDNCAKCNRLFTDSVTGTLSIECRCKCHVS
jgi:hypothetical protein